MARETIADKMAKKTFFSPSFQKSWLTHAAAFGPILEPAFPEDLQARVHLTAALNQLAAKDPQGALKKLQQVRRHCQTDADKAAWAYFTGLCYDSAGAPDRARELYGMAGSFDHGFYLPYLKVAMAAHGDRAYDLAEGNYRQALLCLHAHPPAQKGEAILTSAWLNYCACLTLMHRYEEAREALAQAKATGVPHPGLDATEAVLLAALGRREELEALLSRMEEQNSPMADRTRRQTEEILSGKHFQFSVLPFDIRLLEEFWDWFADMAPVLEKKLRDEEHDSLISLMNKALKALTPFLETEPEFGFQPGEGRTRVDLADFYSRTLRAVYEELLRRMPESLKGTWEFTITH